MRTVSPSMLCAGGGAWSRGGGGAGSGGVVGHGPGGMVVSQHALRQTLPPPAVMTL